LAVGSHFVPISCFVYGYCLQQAPGEQASTIKTGRGFDAVLKTRAAKNSMAKRRVSSLITSTLSFLPNHS
jgi:hypothetical protein